MHQVVADRFSQLGPFFQHGPPNEPMVRAFLEGRVPGRAFVDDHAHPRSCAIAVNYCVVFFGGERSLRFQAQAINQFRRDEDLFVVWTDGFWRRPWWLRPTSVGRRVEFRRREIHQTGQLKKLQRAAGDGIIKRIDGRLLEHCTWRDEVVHAVGSVSEFFNQGFGFCVMVGETVAAEAYACFWGHGKVELVAYTAAAYRRRGYAAALCAYVIETCEALELETYWCCDPRNAASMRLAAKLGFINPRRFGLLRYRHARANSLATG